MARKVEIFLVDDYDGGEAAETVGFGLDGVSYEIDLSEQNAQALRDAVQHHVERARRTGGRKPGETKDRRPAVDRDKAKAIRTWAQTQGHSITDRGRLSNAIIDAYERTHSK